MREVEKWSPIETLDQLLSDMEAMANAPGEEPGLSELDHGLQCAEELRQMAPNDIDLQLAGLLHDIAHSRCPISHHAQVGADAVRPLLGERIAHLIGLHADAKRYLVTTTPEYLLRLSPISRKSFELQGGLMSQAEVARFAADPEAANALWLRSADDAAKAPGRIVPGMDAWLAPLRAAAQ